MFDPRIEPTNWKAEQAIRPAVVNRKVWGGNRTKAGGETQAVTSSVLRTCQKKSIDVFQFLGAAFRKRTRGNLSQHILLRIVNRAGSAEGDELSVKC